MILSFQKRIAFVLSFFIHALIILGLYYHESQPSQDTSWSGGAGVQAGTVYMTISTLETKIPAIQSKLISKNLKNRSRQTSQKLERSIGHSTTPSGGTGSGLDKTGTVSQNAPNILAAIRKKIVSHQNYPFTARTQNLEGSVKINFKINPNGSLTFSKVIRSSGHKILDEAALKALKKSVPLPFYPQAIALVLEYALR